MEYEHCATSWSQLIAFRVVASRAFDFMMVAIIVANAVTIGIETSIVVHGGDIPSGLLACEYIFLILYALELAMRFHAVGIKEACRSHWVKFDTVLLIAGVLNLVITIMSVQGGT